MLRSLSLDTGKSSPCINQNGCSTFVAFISTPFDKKCMRSYLSIVVVRLLLCFLWFGFAYSTAQCWRWKGLILRPSLTFILSWEANNSDIYDIQLARPPLYLWVRWKAIDAARCNLHVYLSTGPIGQYSCWMEKIHRARPLWSKINNAYE